MSRPSNESCDNCRFRTELDTCTQWLEQCPQDKGEMEEEDYSVRWCQYWKGVENGKKIYSI